jgi:hypothetical protein
MSMMIKKINIKNKIKKRLNPARRRNNFLFYANNVIKNL